MSTNIKIVTRKCIRMDWFPGVGNENDSGDKKGMYLFDFVLDEMFLYFGGGRRYMMMGRKEASFWCR